ncbi:MAG: SpoIIE family protein phosphatase [Bacteroidia bacterium]
MKKRYLYSFILFLFSVLTYAQQQEIDSLKNVLKATKEDTSRVLTLRLLSIYTDSLSYAHEALQLSQKNNYSKGLALSYATFGAHYYRNQKYDLALEYFIKSKRIAEEKGYNTILAGIYKLIGYIYRPSEPIIAAEYYNKSLTLYKQLKQDLACSYLYSALGNVYEGTPNGTKSALENYEKSLEIRQRLGQPEEIASSLNETSRIYLQLGQTDKAAILWEHGLTIAENANDTENIVYFCNLIGHNYYNKKDYQKALEYQERAYNLVITTNPLNYSMLGEVCLGLANAYAKTNQHIKSITNYQRYIEANDTVRNRTNNTNLTNLKHMLATEREKEHLLLKDAEIENQKITLEKQIVLRNAFLVGFALVIALVIFIYKGYRQKQKANYKLDITNKKIEHAYKIIEDKTKSITDSIHYALRIQRAALPHRSEIWATFKNSFVLYKPKDIVSGDFYWFHKNENTILIAAVDCTGHGVPGAFMSLIGSERLNDAVINENNPGNILSLLNKGVKTSLRQSENAESTRDGMDIALCSIDLKNKLLCYAGANRPLWIIRKNSNSIEEIKPTKTSIGGLTENNQVFENHTLKYEEGDSFYIFTDGFYDQFGGKNGKKLSSKTLKELLLSIQDKSMHDQEKYLSDFLESWKGNLEQVDDILIIGVKL